MAEVPGAVRVVWGWCGCQGWRGWCGLVWVPGVWCGCMGVARFGGGAKVGVGAEAWRGC